MQNVDLIIVGAGPVGLYAAFYAGMRGLSVAMIESAEVAGGQPQNLYPEKLIYDVAGLPAISGINLTKNLLEQVARVPHELFLGESVQKIEKVTDGFFVSTDKEKRSAKAVLLTTGAGLLTPRKLGVEREEQFAESGKISYFIQSLEEFRGKRVAVLGGGDSALDWSLMLENVAEKVYLIHRRTAFRAHEITVEQISESSVKIHVPYTLSALTETGLLLTKVKSDEKVNLSVDKILVNYGFVTNHIDLIDEIELSRNGRVKTNREQQSNIEGLYAAGDASDYIGKVPLMSAGFGEAVTAINAMTKVLTLDHAIRKGHSSSLF
ncbi:NAD(P)/FAD-dependent oxidoreductase [Lactococcus protaetiae]|uniref:Ferredoxin--NADP reductase n=1 Tax=Lactococcus protaetiae TaxID=2592653 RepID=A0A514ZAM0_9LACT|nr:NAD(P)/FAD-dependent oxidoreductase [Lactococcus protaetiae]QDK71634.1 NAD(P)/FAD-dependent oxidoreductase [Lactococcus protaetiae]